MHLLMVWGHGQGWRTHTGGQSVHCPLHATVRIFSKVAQAPSKWTCLRTTAFSQLDMLPRSIWRWGSKLQNTWVICWRSSDRSRQGQDKYTYHPCSTYVWHVRHFSVHHLSSLGHTGNLKYCYLPSAQGEAQRGEVICFTVFSCTFLLWMLRHHGYVYICSSAALLKTNDLNLSFKKWT